MTIDEWNNYLEQSRQGKFKWRKVNRKSIIKNKEERIQPTDEICT
jgi:hypothetical protein